MKTKVSYKNKFYDIYYSKWNSEYLIDQIYLGAELLYDASCDFNSKNLPTSVDDFVKLL
jgi:hypothetical protein